MKRRVPIHKIKKTKEFSIKAQKRIILSKRVYLISLQQVFNKMSSVETPFTRTGISLSSSITLSSSNSETAEISTDTSLNTDSISSISPAFSSSRTTSKSYETVNTAGTNENSSNGQINGDDTKKDYKQKDDYMFDCNICLDIAKDAVISMCGHLFCWPCLHQWLETRLFRKLCPVCKAGISKEKVIPLYGRNSTKQEDSRNKVPPRPAGKRTETEPLLGFQGVAFGGVDFQMAFPLSPFTYFTLGLNYGEARPAAAVVEPNLSILFIYFAVVCMVWFVLFS